MFFTHNTKPECFLNSSNKSCLDYACYIGHNEIVLLLLENGALVHDIDPDHFNCFDIAIEQEHKCVVETLILNKNFRKFFYFENEKESKLKKMIKKMPLAVKTLLDSCYDYDSQKYDFQVIDNETYNPTRDHPLWIISHYHFKYLLGHETVKRLLKLKMSKGPGIIFW